jgi:hypothetical protein
MSQSEIANRQTHIYCRLILHASVLINWQRAQAAFALLALALQRDAQLFGFGL